MLNPGMPDTLTNMKYNPPKTIAGKFVDQFNQVEESEGIRKIVVDPSMIASMAQGGAADAAALMQQMMGAVSTEQSSIPAGLPPEAAALMQQMLSGNQKVEENPDAGLDMVRKRPEFLEKALKDAESRDRFLVDIDNSSVLDLVLKKSTKSDVVNALKTLSNANYQDNMQEGIFYYTDVGLAFYFDGNDCINEIEVDEKYRRTTTKGLKINDPLEKAVELYGPPRMKSAKGAIWNKFSVLMRDRANEIMLIRLKIRE